MRAEWNTHSPSSLSQARSSFDHWALEALFVQTKLVPEVGCGALIHARSLSLSSAVKWGFAAPGASVVFTTFLVSFQVHLKVSDIVCDSGWVIFLSCVTDLALALASTAIALAFALASALAVSQYFSYTFSEAHNLASQLT